MVVCNRNIEANRLVFVQTANLKTIGIMTTSTDNR